MLKFRKNNFILLCSLPETFFFHKLKMEEDLLNMCTKCGNTPCLVALMGQELVDEGNRYKSNNNAGNNKVRFRLCRLFARKICGVLGSDHRIPLPMF